MTRLLLAALVIVLTGVSLTPVNAQSDRPAVLRPVQTAKLFRLPEGNKLLVPAAKLMRVDEGVFELEIGKVIDLTDRKILLAMSLSGRRKECCTLTLNGQRINWGQVGGRIDLKRERSTSPFVEDKEICYLDVVDIALPKGAPGIATFRLHCI